MEDITMKLAFSTIGCRTKNWDETCRLAREQGFSGFEVRDLGPKTLTYDKFANTAHAATRAELDAMGIGLTCFSIGPELSENGEKLRQNFSSTQVAKARRQEAQSYIKTASGLGSKYVRLQIDDYTTKDDNDAAVIEAIDELAPFAEAYGVTLLVESKGNYSDTARLRNLLAGFRSDSVGALWDVDHTVHSGGADHSGETPAQTIDNLGTMVKYVHLRDSIKQSGVDNYKFGGAAYTAMGDGDIPIEKAIMALRSINFDGYVSFEWLGDTDALYPDDADAPFKDFVSYIATHFAKDFASGDLLYNDNRKNGKYFWPKKQLVNLTLPQVFDRVCKHFPNKLAFDYSTLEHPVREGSSYHRSGYTRTYAEFREDVDEFARSLIALGVRPGDKVAIWCGNVPEWFITFWAAVKIGAVLVTVNTAYKIHETEFLLRQSDTHTLVFADGTKEVDYASIIHTLVPELKTLEPGEQLFSAKLPFLRNVITIDSEQPGCRHWTQALKKASEVTPAELAAQASVVKPDDVCNMQYTSGTTGFPKGVMLTHYNIANNGKNIGDGMDLSTYDRMMIQVPMFHCFGMVLAMTACVTHGSAMSPIPFFSPRLGLDCINKKRITAFHGVPTMFIAMLGHDNFPATDFQYMRTGIMAGSPCPEPVMLEVLDKMNMKEICIVFGQTESSPGCTMTSTSEELTDRVGTVGTAFYGVECKIVDPETGADLPDNVDGEFVARGYNIMKGYYKLPEATAQAIDADGWLHTGDLARRDARGYYKITGRIKDMIIRGGENIYPKEIEDFIYTHPKVQDVQVVGIADEQYGEEVLAAVILKPGETASASEIKDYVKASMAKHKTPRYVEFVESFPTNAAGKVIKYKLREMFSK
jgi:fatty-acyl-CoA synthase